MAGTVFQRIENSTAVVLATPEFLPTELFSSLIASEAITKNPTGRQLKEAQIGITEAVAGVARTGSVCVSENSNLSGMVSSFAREHICLLDANFIIGRPREVFTDSRLRNTGIEENFVFITGPSATADMGELVYGVHGPASLHILVLE